MIDISKTRAAVIENQEIILNKLTDLKYIESIKLIASLSSLLANIDHMHAETENLCCKKVIENMHIDPRSTITKAEAAMKSTDLYVSHKDISSLRQCTSRGLGIVRLHLHYLLKQECSSIGEDLESSAMLRRG